MAAKDPSQPPSNSQMTWKRMANRQDGLERYQFGDIARSLVSGTKKVGKKAGSIFQPSERRPQAEGCTVSDVPEGPVLPTNEVSPRDSVTGSSATLDQAMLGLQTLQSGVLMFGEIDLPYGAAALEKIQQGIQELEARVQESIAYERLQPQGGQLQQVQVCVASGDEDPPEWSMGQLYVSSDALLFESSEIPPWRIGPVKWSSIAVFEKLQGSGHIRLATHDSSSHVFNGISDLEVLERLGGLKDEVINQCLTVSQVGEGAVETRDKESTLVTQVIEPDAFIVGGHSSPKQDELPATGMAEVATAYEATGTAAAAEAPATDEAACQQTSTPAEAPPEGWLASFMVLDEKRAMSSTLPPSADTAPVSSFCPTGSFAAAADALPEVHAEAAALVFQEHMPKATLKGIKKFLSVDKEWPLRLFLEEHLKVFDVEESRWAASQRIPGTQMRRMRFKMPVPADVPAAVKKLISLPPWTKATHLARLGCSQNQIVLVQEICTHDVTYGNNFWVQDVLTFQTDPATPGVMVKKYINVKWVIALPWYAGVLSTFIEMKAKQDAGQAGAYLCKYLAKEGFVEG